MDPKRLVKLSKFLSLILRHHPEEIGIELDPAGWTEVDGLLEAMNRHRVAITMEELEEVVANNDKKRYSFSEDRRRIRASQGHSVEVELGYRPMEPPEQLYHGTVAQFLDSIYREGLVKGGRHHVHLSVDAATAAKVGQRRGRPSILAIRAGQMHRDGFPFYLSDNGVWLTDHVPPKYIEADL